MPLEVSLLLTESLDHGLEFPQVAIEFNRGEPPTF